MRRGRRREFKLKGGSTLEGTDGAGWVFVFSGESERDLAGAGAGEGGLRSRGRSRAALTGLSPPAGPPRGLLKSHCDPDPPLGRSESDARSELAAFAPGSKRESSAGCQFGAGARAGRPEMGRPSRARAIVGESGDAIGYAITSQRRVSRDRNRRSPPGASPPADMVHWRRDRRCPDEDPSRELFGLHRTPEAGRRGSFDHDRRGRVADMLT